MAHYVDGFVIPMPKDKLAIYRRIAQKACKIWREHGALNYRECVGDDLDVKDMVPFPRMAKFKPDETVVFSWIVFKSRAHRDSVNAKVMQGPAPRQDDGAGSHALRLQAHGLRWIQDDRRSLTLAPGSLGIGFLFPSLPS